MSDAQKIVPNLWFNGTAAEAADWYTSIFPGGTINATSRYPESAAEGLADFQQGLAGKVLTVDFSLGGYRFVGINAGAEFAPNHTLSFFVYFNAARSEHSRQELDALWAKLMDGGEALMELGTYPFSEHYGWVKDKYGVSWQLMLTPSEGVEHGFIVPSLLFTGITGLRAEEALTYYAETFHDSKQGHFERYAEGQGAPGTVVGSLMYGDVQLDGQWLAAMDSPFEQQAVFTEGVSLAVNCKDQAEIDDLWSKLSARPENEQCGWCKDKFGVSWQIVPGNMEELMQQPGAFATLMQQKKIVIDAYYPKTD